MKKAPRKVQIGGETPENNNFKDKTSLVNVLISSSCLPCPFPVWVRLGPSTLLSLAYYFMHHNFNNVKPFVWWVVYVCGLQDSRGCHTNQHSRHGHLTHQQGCRIAQHSRHRHLTHQLHLNILWLWYKKRKMGESFRLVSKTQDKRGHILHIKYT